jgi:hypothetical protein
MRATVQNAPVLTAVQSKPYCESDGGVLPFVVNGYDVVNNGQRLAYYADSLVTTNQTVEIPIGQDLKDDLNITISCPA